MGAQYHRHTGPQGAPCLHKRTKVPIATLIATQATKVLIATGTKPSMPNIPGIELCSTSDDILDAPRRPERVAIVGSGYIGGGVGMEGELFCEGMF